MQHAVALSGEEEENRVQSTALEDEDSSPTRPTKSEPIKLTLSYTWWAIKSLFHLLRPSTIRQGYTQARQMTFKDMIKGFYSLLIKCIQLIFLIIFYAFRYVEMKIHNE